MKIIKLEAFFLSSLLDKSLTPFFIISAVYIMVVLYIFSCLVLVYCLRAKGDWFEFMAVRKKISKLALKLNILLYISLFA